MIFPLSRRVRTRIYMAVFCVAGVLSWKLALRLGPDLSVRNWKPGDGFFDQKSTPPGVFGFHAHLILNADLGFPRALEGYLPEPGKDLNRRLQLEVMGWWKNGAWTPLALTHGVVEGNGLRIQLGRMLLDRVEGVTPARDYNGPTLCQVDFRVRWDLPEDLRPIVQSRSHTGLRMPERLDIDAPGSTQALQCTLVRDGLGWKLQDAGQVRDMLPGRASGRAMSWLDPLL